jgi:hypothetical protein
MGVFIFGEASEDAVKEGWTTCIVTRIQLRKAAAC